MESHDETLFVPLTDPPANLKSPGMFGLGSVTTRRVCDNTPRLRAVNYLAGAFVTYGRRQWASAAFPRVYVPRFLTLAIVARLHPMASWISVHDAPPFSMAAIVEPVCVRWAAAVLAPDLALTIPCAWRRMRLITTSSSRWRTA
jgi:hypothetical protein